MGNLHAILNCIPEAESDGGNIRELTFIKTGSCIESINWTASRQSSMGCDELGDCE